MKRFAMQSAVFSSSIFAFLLLCVFVSSAHAQGVPSVLGVDLTASAENPVPGQQVTVTARSFNADIQSAKVTWSVNGKVTQSGPGLTTLVVTAPPLGKKLSISVTAITTEGVAITGSIAVSSGSVDLIVETDGYTPASFRGKNPIVYQNSVKVIAVPHIADSTGKEYDPKTLVYQWQKNDRAIEDQSGYGKQSVTLVGDIVPRPYDLTVTVSPKNGSSKAQGIMTITPDAPSISFYVDDPLYGPLLNSAIGDTIRIGSQKETDVIAVPYGFNKPTDGVGDLTLKWLINNIEHVELAANDSVVLRAPAATAGSSNIELDIRNGNQVLQGATAGFTASFTAF